MHTYNNQVCSTPTAMTAAKNMMGSMHGLWQVKVDHKYHEESGSDGTDGQASAVSSTRLGAPERARGKEVGV